MKCALCLATLALVSVAAAFSPLPAAIAPQAPPCVNAIRHEPVLVYEISGYTLGGLVDRMLTVYADGSLKISSADFGGPGKAMLGNATPAELQSLTQTLQLAGAFSACDDTAVVSDVPLKTLTFFRGSQNAMTHSFSWWIGTPPYDAIEQPLEAFVAQHFPGF